MGLDERRLAELLEASSLEPAVETSKAALRRPFIDDGNAVVVKFAPTTTSRLDEHRQAFFAPTTAPGGKGQYPVPEVFETADVAATS